jgi:SAM-dependent methyltransferase
MNESADEATLKFYGQEAKKYCERTASAPTAILGEFLARLPQDATILELGCGSGRDSAETLQRGYNVLPTDGSPEMARQAERRLNRPVAVENDLCGSGFVGVVGNPRSSRCGVR